MTIEKRSKNSWRIKEQHNGILYSVNYKSDKEPTKKLAKQLIADEISKGPVNNTDSFSFCANKYVNLKKNRLSESTKGEYLLKIKRFSEEFQNMPVDAIGQIEMQREIDLLTAKLAPKTVKDMYGFMNSVLSLYQSNYRKYSITLPQPKNKEPYIPSDDDIKAILKAAENTPFSIAIRLGCWGLRRSEICCITSADLDDDNTLHVNKALVQNKSTKEWYVKAPKTSKSERNIIIPEDLADDIRKAKKAYEGYPGSISNWLRRTQDELGLQHFSLHKERHYFCSTLFELGYDEATILKMGGWATDHVAKTVYRHSRIEKDKEKQKEIAKKLSEKLG